MSSAILASISPVRSERLLAMAAAFDRLAAKLVSISCKDAIADNASTATVVSGMGVGDGLGFCGEAKGCWPNAGPTLKVNAGIKSKTSRLTR